MSKIKLIPNLNQIKINTLLTQIILREPSFSVTQTIISNQLKSLKSTYDYVLLQECLIILLETRLKIYTQPIIFDFNSIHTKTDIATIQKSYSNYGVVFITDVLTQSQKTEYLDLLLTAFNDKSTTSSAFIQYILEKSSRL